MRLAITSLIVATLLLSSAFIFHVSFTHKDELAFVEDDIEEVEFSPKSSSEHGSSECCTTGSAGFINKHYFLASTMDGKMTAMDVNNNGEIVWTADADQVPLLSSSLGSQKLMIGNFPYMLVPSLDGSLYMFNVESSALSPIPMGANVRLMVGNDEVAGGTFVTSTGIDPLTGQIRYRCTAGKCVQSEASTDDLSPSYTLIMRKNTQIARAADPLTGVEKWNVSVGEYDISLVSSDRSFRFERVDAPAHVRFRLEPPTGAISAVDSCGNLVWKKRLPSPLARAWQLSRGRIFEVSLFSSENVGALSDFIGNSREFIPKYEAPFYFGTVNSEPYIIMSEFLREKLRRTANSQLTNYQSQTISTVSSLNAPFLEDMKVGDLIRRSYRTTANAIEADPVNGVPNPTSSKSLTCSMHDAVTIAGSRELQDYEGNDPSKGDVGWYIFKPFHKSCKENMMFQGSDRKEKGNVSYKKRCKRRNVFEGLKQIAHEPVSGWWKIVALFLTLVAGSLTAIVILYSQQIRHHKLFVLLHDLKKSSSTHSNTSPMSLQNTTHSNVGTTPGGIQMTPERKTTSTLGSESPQEPFSSKFLEDFIPEKWLGRGAYGVVFNCRNRLDDRSYAVKRIAVSNTTAAIDHVRREARAMARLDHPGIIRYFHTWMERPPAGWQQAKDKEILRNIRSIADPVSDSLILTSESELDRTQPRDDSTSESLPSAKLLRGGIKVNSLNLEEVDAVSNNTSDLSWMESGSNIELKTSSESDSSSINSVNGCIPPGITAVAAGTDDSMGIIFAHDGNSLHDPEDGDEKRSKHNASPEPFGPPAVLVTSMADLQNCKQTKDYVYLYIQMELCQELTLHNWLLANNRDEDREITRMRTWLAELVCAIDYIHSKGLIHRDLKPQNIFFSADNYMKIGDLGLATNYLMAEKVTDYKPDVKTSLSHTSNVGTRLYMSPEQLKRKPYNEKVDIFSLGLIFIELIVPFTTVMERNNILSGLQNGIIPQCLDSHHDEEKKFLTWLTAVDPERRPSARQIAECEYLRNEIQMLGTSYFREHIPSSTR